MTKFVMSEKNKKSVDKNKNIGYYKIVIVIIIK